MPINLSNVHISLQQFHEIASGQHDAGYVRLSSETSLAGTPAAAAGLVPSEIDRSEIIAIKNALLSALSEYGFKDKHKLNSIRERLGLAPKDGESDDDLASRSFSPLSRAEVRRILDEMKL